MASKWMVMSVWSYSSDNCPFRRSQSFSGPLPRFTLLLLIYKSENARYGMSVSTARWAGSNVTNPSLVPKWIRPLLSLNPLRKMK